MDQNKVKIQAIGKTFEIDIPVKLYPSNFEILEEPDTTDTDKIDFLINLFELVKGNFDYVSNNRVIRGEMRNLARRLKNERAAYINKFIADKERQRKGGLNSQETQKTQSVENEDINQVSLKCDSSDTQVNYNYNYNYNYNNKKENLIKESEDDERGIFESLGVEEKKPFFSLLDCWRLFEDWRDVNEIDARQLAWHSTDAKVQTICRNIASAPEGERADMIRQLSWDSAHMARLAVNRETWRGMWQVCKLITKHKFSHLQREKIVTTFDELNKLELPDFYTRFVKQVEYMTGQERINDVEKCLKFEFRNELEQCQ